MGNFRKPYSIFTAILGAFMVFVYAGLGVILLVVPYFAEMIKGTPRTLLGILLILYSLWRIYRLYKTWKERDEEE
jgi:hypothetical protein